MIVTGAVAAYLQQLRPDPDPVLAEMEAQAAREGIPVVVPATGQLLHVVARACGARRVLEVGTAIGVSTLDLARAVGEEGEVVSFEIDPDRYAVARECLNRAGVSGQTDLRLEDARLGVPTLEGEFDLAFVDGVKTQYGEYFEALLPLLRRGGVLAVDNVRMGGTVAEARGDGQWTQEQIEGARAFNQRLLRDESLTGTIVPVGDGVLMAVRL